MEENGKSIKVILLGESGVGKTSIILRYYQNQFEPNSLSTIGSTYIIKQIKKDNMKYNLNIWDTSGQEKYRAVTKLFVQNANIVILVYSIVEEKSFEALDYWYTSILDTFENKDKIVFAIVGNKYDLFTESDTVSEEDAMKFAEEKKAIFKLVSAKSDKKGLDSLFEQLLNEYIKKNPEQKISQKNFKISQIKKENKKGNSRQCC